jgi:hypothetical protein
MKVEQIISIGEEARTALVISGQRTPTGMAHHFMAV